MSDVDVPGAAYAVTLAIGGLIGFIKAGSLPSLIAGVGSGALIFVGAQRAQTTGKADLAFAVSAALVVLMGRRFSNSGKFMPSGLITLLSAGFSVRYGLRLAK